MSKTHSDKMHSLYTDRQTVNPEHVLGIKHA